jgi:hypothetical protein
MHKPESSSSEAGDVVTPWDMRGIPALLAVTTLVVGAALSVGVMVGLLGLPVAGIGLVATTITSRRLVGVAPSVACAWLARLAGNLAGLATGIACLAFAVAAGEGLLAGSRGGDVRGYGSFGPGLLACAVLWAAGPLLGVAAFGIARIRPGFSWGFAIGLWTVAPPATAALVTCLYASGWMALTA